MALTSSQDFQPAFALSHSTVRRQVVLGRPTFLLAIGVQLSDGPIYTRDGSSVEKDHPSSINTGRTMRRTIGVSWDSFRVYTGQVFFRRLSCNEVKFSWIVCLLPAFIHRDVLSVLTGYPQ